MHPHIDRIDQAVARLMGRIGPPAHRITLGLFFTWMGALKIVGHKTGSSVLAQTIYLGSPGITIPILGAWEALIGLCMLFRPTVRIAILLLAIRLPGTLLALILKSSVCFEHIPLVPTLAGQYLLKDLMLFAAAMVIGAELRSPDRSPKPR